MLYLELYKHHFPYSDLNGGVVETMNYEKFLALSPPITTIVPYANSLDLDKTPSNSASHPDPSCLTLRQYFHQLWATLKHFEIEADDNLFGRLRVKTWKSGALKFAPWEPWLHFPWSFQWQHYSRLVKMHLYQVRVNIK